MGIEFAHWRDALGLLSVALAVVAAVIYIVQTLTRRSPAASALLVSVRRPEPHWLLGAARPRRAPRQLDAAHDDNHLLSLCCGKHRSGREELFEARMGVCRRRGRGVRALLVFPRRECRGGADDGHRRAWLWPDIRTRLVLPTKGQRHEFRDQRTGLSGILCAGPV